VQGGALAQGHSKYPTLKWIFSIFPNRTAPRLDYQLNHHTTLYKVCKGSKILDQRIRHKLQGKLDGNLGPGEQ
jgi:hypothetical protein